MTYLHAVWVTVVLLSFGVPFGRSDNLTCYQCTKKVNEECSNEELKPCSPEKDRCVTHIMKDATNGFAIKRECGLGPCAFDDDRMNRGLGLDGCDRSKDEYFCLFCCRVSGCNKSQASFNLPSIFNTILFTTISLIVIHSNLV